MKKKPTAHTRLKLDFWRYLLPLKINYNMNKNKMLNVICIKWFLLNRVNLSFQWEESALNWLEFILYGWEWVCMRAFGHLTFVLVLFFYALRCTLYRYTPTDRKYYGLNMVGNSNICVWFLFLWLSEIGWKMDENFRLNLTVYKI